MVTTLLMVVNISPQRVQIWPIWLKLPFFILNRFLNNLQNKLSKSAKPFSSTIVCIGYNPY